MVLLTIAAILGIIAAFLDKYCSTEGILYNIAIILTIYCALMCFLHTSYYYVYNLSF
jgi:MFS-type transporter involved in bile tolerance (Atg22 family)